MKDVALFLLLFLGVGALITWLDISPISVSVVVEKREEQTPDLDESSRQRASHSSNNLRTKEVSSNSEKTRSKRPPSVQTERRIFFVHIGKCGGATLKKNLRAKCVGMTDEANRQRCVAKMQHAQEPLLSKQSVGYMHTTNIEPNQETLDDATSLLVIARNPIERVVSWFVFTSSANCEDPNADSCNHAPKAEQLFACFPKSVDDFAKSLSPDSSGECSDLAKRAIKLDFHGLGHLELNYEFYFKRMGGLSKEILLVRTEHLWEDVGNIESFLSTGKRGNGSGDNLSGFVGPEQMAHKHLDNIDRSLSPEGSRNLCCYLVEEIRIYNMLLEAAVNLKKAEVAASENAVLVDTCGVPNLESLEQACSGYPP